MPTRGMEPVRRDAPIRATIAEIGHHGTLRANAPEERIHAIIEADRPDPDTVAAWPAFHVEARRSPEAAWRLDGNPVHELRRLVREAAARRVAQGLAALTDGFCIRIALQDRMSARHDIKTPAADHTVLNAGRPI